MNQQILSELIVRDLDKLVTELKSFKHEENIWKAAPGVTNSAGNLTLHLVGNLNHFIGSMLGNSGYQRNRDAEFASKNVTRATLIESIHATKTVVASTFSSVTDAALNEDFPFEVFGKKSALHYVTLFYGHLSYHLGQVNYLRRILEA